MGRGWGWGVQIWGQNIFGSRYGLREGGGLKILISFTEMGAGDRRILSEGLCAVRRDLEDVGL